jgi:hypothetical protein
MMNRIQYDAALARRDDLLREAAARGGAIRAARPAADGPTGTSGLEPHPRRRSLRLRFAYITHALATWR